jgi:DNA-binding CsgD family transcriptional regulator
MSDLAYETVGLKPGDKTITTWDSFVDLMHPDDREHANLRLTEILASPGPVELEARVVNLDGTVHLVSARCAMEYDAGGKLVRGYGTTYDVIDGSARQGPAEWYRVLIGAPRLVEEAGPPKSPEEIIATLYGSPSALQRRLEAARAAAAPQLTGRELEILELLRDGLDAARIAKALGISIHTVRDHLKRVRQKLGVQSQLQAVVKASSLGLLRQLA